MTEVDVMLFYLFAALPVKFQRCHSEKEGRTAKPATTAGERERNSQTQQNGVSKGRWEMKEMENNEDVEIMVGCPSFWYVSCPG